MANAKYGLYIQEQLTPNNPVDWAADNIKVVLVDTAENRKGDEVRQESQSPGNMRSRTEQVRADHWNHN